MAQRKKLVIVFFVVCFLMLVLSCAGLLRCCLFGKEPTTPAGTYVGAYGPVKASTDFGLGCCSGRAAFWTVVEARD